MSEGRSIPTSAPADRPSFKIKVGGRQITGEYQIQSVIVSRSFDRVAAAEIHVLDGDPSTEDFVVSNSSDFVPGQEVEILAGYHGDEEVVFKGIVVRHGLRVFQSKPSLLRVDCRDAAIKLASTRKNAYFYDSTDAEIIEELAGNAGLTTSVEPTDVTHAEMVQFYSTDWDFIVARSEANGKVVVTRDGELVVKAPDASGQAALSLTYGGNMLDFEASMDARDQLGSVLSLSWDATNQEMLEVEAETPSAVSPGNFTHEDLAAVVNPGGAALKHAGQLKESELQAWANGRSAYASFSKVRGRARIQGFSGIGPGDVVELGGVGDRFNGKALVSGVRHEINGKNWETDIAFGIDPRRFSEVHPDTVEPLANGLLPGVSGLHIGVVTALEGDPDGEHRVRVRVPMVNPQDEGVWARVATLDAGDGRGSFFRPEINDEVILGFLSDDPRFPILIGMLNSSAKPAPIDATDDNHEKGFVTRGKMKILFNDETKVMTLETPNGNKVILSDEEGSVTLSDENGNTVTLGSDGVTIKSSGDINLKADGDINVEGSNVSTAATAQLKAEGSSGAELSSGGSTVVKGSVVQIN